MDAEKLKDYALNILEEQKLSRQLHKAVVLCSIVEELGHEDRKHEHRLLLRYISDHEFQRRLGYKELVVQNGDGQTYYAKGHRPSSIFDASYNERFESQCMRAMMLIRSVITYALTLREAEVSFT